MNRSTKVWFCLALLFLPLFLSACHPPDTSHAQKEIQVILKAKANPPDFWRIVEQGVQVAAKEFSVRCVVKGPTAEKDVEAQIALMEDAVASHPDAIVLAAGDYERLAPVCEKAAQAGIPLVVIDSNVNSSASQCFVGTNNYELGKKLAEQLMIYSTPEESFGIIGHVKNSTTAMERKEGLLESLPRAQERLADIQFCGSSVELAKEQTIAMIRSHPEITCMVGLNESSALGICQALAELELNGKIKVIACDSSQEQIQYMEQGMIQAFVIQQPFNMGYLGVQFAVDLANGKRVPENYDTGCIVVTKETLYTPENQKLLFPFTENE